MATNGRILVLGATGAQGGSVARHLLDGGGAVRCLTRNPASEKAQALAAAGAEVVAGDLEDPGSLRAALRDCSAAFGVTNFWEHFAKEAEQGRNLVDAVADSAVEHFVFSTLPSAKTISGGTLDVPHFDIKAELEEYAREKGLPATFLHVAFYYENFLHFFPPQPSEDGSFAFGFPQGDTPLAAYSVEDTGGPVAAIFARREEFLGKTVGVVGADLPPAEYARLMSEAAGERIVYNFIPREVFAGFGFPGAEDLANMFDFNRLYIPNRREDLEQSRALYPGMQDFATWATKNREAIRKALGVG
jgi:uncharacterized protein YbjT (DUF2867 family)